MNSSKIVLNTSASFSSLRIENPKKAGPLTKESESNLKLFISNIPLINQLFTIQTMVGEGTFSKVYKAKHNQSQVDFALKCVIPTIKPSRIIPELRYLRDMGGDSNIIEIKTCLFESGYTIIVMPFFQHDRFSEYIKDMDLDEIKEYMRNLLIALKKVHSNNVIHRDIKPNNFLYNRSERKFALVDFGLAQYEADVLKASKAINRIHSTTHHHQLNNSKKHHHHKNNNVNKTIEQNHLNSLNSIKETNNLIGAAGLRTVQTANSLFKSKDKMICVRKRLLTFENDDENIFPHKIKRSKHDSPTKYRSSIFNTPSTPSTIMSSVAQSLTNSNKNAMQNMTNLQSTPTTLTTNNSNNLQPASLAPLSCFNINVVPNFNFDSISKPLTPDNSSIISIDPFKTPTKQQRSTTVLGQLQNSPNSIIPETPPKSSNRPDKKVSQLQSASLRLSKLLNSSSVTASTTTTTNTPVANATTTKSTITSKSHHKSSSNIASLSSSMSSVNLNCKCFGLDQICKICTKRNECMAPRAGTPGFRAPEVLLKHLCQTSAIDIWSVGVIFASLLTKKFPFFRNTDDMTSLAEIISIFGSERVEKAAQAIGKQLTSSEKNVPPVDLKETLTKLRGDQMQIDDSAFDLLDKLLDPNPLTRIKASDALDHSFLKRNS